MKRKFIAVMRDDETKECYIQFFRGKLKSDILTQRRHDKHKVEAVFDFNEKNIIKTKNLKSSLNRLAKYLK